MNGTNVDDATKRKHVVPDDGCVHVMNADCWCRPEPMEEYPLIYVHVPHAPGSNVVLH